MHSAQEHDHALMVREKHRVAWTSVGAAVALTAMKLAVGLWTGSLGILSEALHSGLDLLAALITLLAVRVADRPADEDHQFGHGKFENLSALFETLLLLATCMWILYEAWERLSSGAVHIDLNVWAFVVVIVSIIVDISRSRALMRVARKYNSQALEADALHFSSDIYSSLVVLVGLVSVAVGFPAADAIAAAIVAAIVIGISVRLGKRTIDGLLDRVPEGSEQRIREVVMDVDGVESIRRLRIRPSGGALFINLVIGIQRTAYFSTAHDIVDKVEEAVLDALPRCDILVHAEPVVGVREKFADSIEWLVRRHGVRPHNLQILWVDDSYVLDFDIEFPQGTSFREAHDIASQVENTVREALPMVGQVHIHLEEDSVTATPGRDASAEEGALLHRLGEVIAAHPAVRKVGAIRCYTTPDGLKVSASCALPAGMSLAAMHAEVDALESAIKAVDARIRKVFLHAEPGETA